LEVDDLQEIIKNIASTSMELGSNEVAVIFDLTKPLEPQIESARELVRSQQREALGKLTQSRRAPEKWLGYLRALDGRAAEASWRQIAGLYPNTAQKDQTARDIHRQALALCFNF
jgi:hypothetical protein